MGPPFAVGECGRRVRPPPTAKGGLFPPFAVCGVREEGCGRKAKKEREIVQHKAKHSALDAKRAAALDLMAGLIP